MRRRHAAFTVLELLVAVAVIAVLASISVPVFNRIKARSLSSACQNNLRTLGVALNVYIAEHHGVLPTMVAARSSPGDDEPALDTVLAEYIDGSDAFICPADAAGIGHETGTSYFWNSLLNGQRSGNESFFGLQSGGTGIPVISDKENFHESVNQEVNILYADGHVATEVQFSVGGRR